MIEPQIDDWLLFGSRRKAEAMAKEWCETRGVSCNAFNIITALDSMNLLDRESTRELISRRRQMGRD